MHDEARYTFRRDAILTTSMWRLTSMCPRRVTAIVPSQIAKSISTTLAAVKTQSAARLNSPGVHPHCLRNASEKPDAVAYPRTIATS